MHSSATIKTQFFWKLERTMLNSRTTEMEILQNMSKFFNEILYRLTGLEGFFLFILLFHPPSKINLPWEPVTCCLHLGKSNRTFLLERCFLPLHLVPTAHTGLPWKSAGQQEKEAAHHSLESDTSSQRDCSHAIRSPRLVAGGALGSAIWKGVCDLPPARASLDFTPCPPSLDLEIVDVRVEGRKRNQTSQHVSSVLPLANAWKICSWWWGVFKGAVQDLWGLAKIFLCPCRVCSTARPAANSLPPRKAMHRECNKSAKLFPALLFYVFSGRQGSPMPLAQFIGRHKK